jgi:hypothetical protein
MAEEGWSWRLLAQRRTQGGGGWGPRKARHTLVVFDEQAAKPPDLGPTAL